MSSGRSGRIARPALSATSHGAWQARPALKPVRHPCLQTNPAQNPVYRDWVCLYQCRGPSAIGKGLISGDSGAACLTGDDAMDAPYFDALARHIGTRRTALGGLLAGLLLPSGAAARGKKGKGEGKDKGKYWGKAKSRTRTGGAPTRKLNSAGARAPACRRKGPTSAAVIWWATRHRQTSTAPAVT